MEGKKTRKPNWSEEEKIILLEEFNKRKNILKSKFDPQITANRKQRMWEEIVMKINSRSLVKRSIQEVQKKYDNLSVLAKKEITKYRRECNKTDVEDVKFVINYDYPNSSEDYIHRIGRTARSQKTGTAYTFFTPGNMRQASDLVSVLREANQAINPKLLQMAEDRGGRSRGGRGGGYRDDRRDRYSSNRRDFGGFRDRDGDRGFDSGPKKAFGTSTQNGGYGAGGYDAGLGAASAAYAAAYSSNGQSAFTANQATAFGAQNFQNQQFAAAQGATPDVMAHPQFPFAPQQPPQQPPQPMVPYPLPPAFPQ